MFPWPEKGVEFGDGGEVVVVVAAALDDVVEDLLDGNLKEEATRDGVMVRRAMRKDGLMNILCEYFFGFNRD